MLQFKGSTSVYENQQEHETRQEAEDDQTRVGIVFRGAETGLDNLDPNPSPWG